ncbi:MAG TPA: hypothetical protein VIO33_11665 [Burkholderiaceae bacterium]
MTTTTLHYEIQRSRFTNLLMAALGAAVPATLGNLLRREAPQISEADKIGREAEAVREMARSYAKTDPGFAADLFAAAARHEGHDE